MSDTEDSPSMQNKTDQPTDNRDPIPPTQRESALERDEYRCQICRNKGAEIGGRTTLHVHHKDSNPDGCEVHDLSNLITLCRVCHNWHHHRPEADELPVEIVEAAEDKLIGADIEILDILAAEGPLTAGEIAEKVSHEPTIRGVKERLYRIMGLDVVVDDQPQLIDQDVDTDKWGFPQQINISERRIPEQVQKIVQRTTDQLMRSAIERGCDRETVSEVFDRHRRTTYNIQYRAQAYDFPVNLFIGKGRPRKHTSPINRASKSGSEEQMILDEVGSVDKNREPNSTSSDNDADLEDTESACSVTMDPKSNGNHRDDTPDRSEMDPVCLPSLDGSDHEYLLRPEDFSEEDRPFINRINMLLLDRLE